MTNEEFLSTKELAKVIKVSEKQVRNLAQRGRLPYYKFGRLNRYKLSEIIELLNLCPRGNQDPLGFTPNGSIK
jgi:excisionase family DNA binding protein